MQNDSIFTKIIKGEIPSHKIYEDEATYAFLDIHPLTEGHVLVVPRQQVEFIWDLPAEHYQSLMASVQRIGKHLKEVLDAPYVGVQVIGVDVPHAHVHVIPFTNVSELHNETASSEEPDHDALAALAERLRF